MMATVDIQHLKTQVDLVSLIGQRVSLRQRGTRWVGRCPFHDDRHPSFDVSPRHQSWRCWACGMRGDALDWVRLTENCTLVEALRRLQGTETPPPKRPIILPEPDPLASRVIRDRAYHALIAAASLTPEHYQALRERGLADAAIHDAGYASLPQNGRDALLTAMQAVGDLTGVPGVSRAINGNRWRLEGSPGLLIPVRDRQGRIQACQIRTDNGGARYQWLSSAPKQPRWTGRSPGTPFHVAGRTWLSGAQQWWYVTEGPLKADVVAAYLERPVIGIPGVGLADKLARALVNWRPATVVIAFDQDAAPDTRARVRDAEAALAAVLVQAGIRVLLRRWPEGPKGFDDALMAGAPPQYDKPAGQIASDVSCR